MSRYYNDFSDFKMEEEFLEHHGILGQKHGQRNGPPYPLDGKSHSAAEKKEGTKGWAKEAISEWRASRKAKKAERKAEKKQIRKEAKEEKKITKNIEREARKIDKELTAAEMRRRTMVETKDVRKNLKLLTNEDLQYIVDRNQKLNKLTDSDIEKGRQAMAKLELAGTALKNVADITNNAYNIGNNIYKGYQLYQNIKKDAKDAERERKAPTQAQRSDARWVLNNTHRFADAELKTTVDRLNNVKTLKDLNKPKERDHYSEKDFLKNYSDMTTAKMEDQIKRYNMVRALEGKSLINTNPNQNNSDKDKDRDKK